MQLMSLFCGQQLLNTVPEPLKELETILPIQIQCTLYSRSFSLETSGPEIWYIYYSKFLSLARGGGGGTPYSRLHREPLPKRGAFSTQGREVYCLKGFWNRPFFLLLLYDLTKSTNKE